MNVEEKIAKAARIIRARRIRDNGRYRVTDETDDIFDDDESVTTSLDAVLAATLEHQEACSKRVAETAEKITKLSSSRPPSLDDE